jgi:hypothetical protein
MSETSPHFVRKKLLKQTDCYVESVGKQDITALGQAMDVIEGKGTVLRLVFGATAAMPLRAITYADSALRIASVIPHEQLQIVHANTLGSRLNAVDRQDARNQAELLAAIVRFHSARFGDIADKVLHAEDTDLDIEVFTACAQEVLEVSDVLSMPLLRKGSKHGGDAVTYASAHAAYQDTDMLNLSPLFNDSPAQVRADRIISIGCDQERLFYGVRMLMRHALQDQVELVDTAQIFTKHSVPPYFVARGGEQLLSHALEQGVNPSFNTDPAARRDINHFNRVIGE